MISTIVWTLPAAGQEQVQGRLPALLRAEPRSSCSATPREVLTRSGAWPRSGPASTSTRPFSRTSSPTRTRCRSRTRSFDLVVLDPPYSDAEALDLYETPPASPERLHEGGAAGPTVRAAGWPCTATASRGGRRARTTRCGSWSFSRPRPPAADLHGSSRSESRACAFYGSENDEIEDIVADMERQAKTEDAAGAGPHSDLFPLPWVELTERLLTARELAEVISLSPNTVLDWFEAGRLPGFRLGGRKGGPVRFRLSEIEVVLESWRAEPDAREGKCQRSTEAPGRSRVSAVSDPEGGAICLLGSEALRGNAATSGWPAGTRMAASARGVTSRRRRQRSTTQPRRQRRRTSRRRACSRIASASTSRQTSCA